PPRTEITSPGPARSTACCTVAKGSSRLPAAESSPSGATTRVGSRSEAASSDAPAAPGARAATVVAESKDTRRRAGSCIAKAPKGGGTRCPKARRPPPPKTQARPAPQNPATTPKGRRSPGRAGSGPGGLPGVVVGRLDGHLDVVRVTLTQAGRGDTHQLTTLPQLCHGPGACVPHGLV